MLRASNFTRTRAHWPQLVGSFSGIRIWSASEGKRLARILFDDYVASLEGVTLPDDPGSRYRPKIPDLFYDGK